MLPASLPKNHLTGDAPTPGIRPQGLLGDVSEVPEALGPWMALPQLAVKALFQPETELLALEVGSTCIIQLSSHSSGM